jgi:hypothetical protein
MRDKQSLHLKVQELCDFFATTDPLKEMSRLDRDEDKDEAALKWLSLAILHGISANAKKISISRSKKEDIKVVSEYRKGHLPNPGPEISQKIVEAVRGITHIEGAKGRIPLAVGFRDGSIELSVKVKKDEDGDSVSLKFPE